VEVLSPVLSRLSAPIVQAPMAGGPSTPELAAAVNRGGGLGFLAAGYLSAERLTQDIAALRELDQRAFGVNVFVGGGSPAAPAAVQAYADQLQRYADATGVALGQPRFDDDAFAAKIALLRADPVAVVSFTFGVPARETIESLQAVGSEVWLTVTSPAEALRAADLGADALVVQGIEAGGHRGVFRDDEEQPALSLLTALQLIGATVELPLIASGSIATGAALGAVLVAGAAAGQIGTAFLRSTEAGTSQAQRDAVASQVPTVLTRAFSGRLARGIRNRWHEEFGAGAPHAYPEVHYLTSPLRAHGRASNDPDLINLWAGQAHELAEARSAQEITLDLAHEARAAVRAVSSRLAGGATPGSRGAPPRLDHED
jgi:nitronate monooxygenase